MEGPDELQMNTVTQKQQFEGKKDTAGKTRSYTNNSNPNNNKNDITSKVVCLPCGSCGNKNHPTENCYYGANVANGPLPWKSTPAVENGPQLQDEQNNLTESVTAAAQDWN